MQIYPIVILAILNYKGMLELMAIGLGYVE